MYYLRKSLVRTARRILGRRTHAARYDQLLWEIDRLRPRTILEIGTHDGINAVRCYKRAALHRNDVSYYGFDLFESQTRESYLREFALKPPSLSQVDRFMMRSGLVRRHLFPGDTLNTLQTMKANLPKMDLIFIDGGHSLETVAADWKNVQDLVHADSVVFFDDYPNWGVGPVVDSIDTGDWNVEILPICDYFVAHPDFTHSSHRQRMKFCFARVTPSAQEATGA